MDGRKMDGWMDETRIDGCMHGWMEGRLVDGWMGG
jgi:hypothetical protein